MLVLSVLHYFIPSEVFLKVFIGEGKEFNMKEKDKNYNVCKKLFKSDYLTNNPYVISQGLNIQYSRVTKEKRAELEKQ